MLSSNCLAEPTHPPDDDFVLLHLPQGIQGDDTLHPWAQLRQRRTQLMQRPNDLSAALEFARFALENGQQQGDPRFYGYVEGALEPWWQRPLPPPEVLLIRATLAQHRHDFGAALEDLAGVLRQRPRWAEAWMSRAVILTVLGDLDQAMISCQPLRRLSTPLLATACRSHVAGLGPQATVAYEELRRHLEPQTSENAGALLWAQITLAQIAHRLGQAETAEGHFLAALEIDPTDLYGLIAYSDFLLDRGQPHRVEALLRSETARTSLMLRLALAEQQLDMPQRFAHIATLKQRYASGEMRQERLHLGEEARFALDLQERPELALGLAQANWQLQREPIDARILLRAALADNDPKAAQKAVDQLENQGLQDVHLTILMARVKKAQP